MLSDRQLSKVRAVVIGTAQRFARSHPELDLEELIGEGQLAAIPALKSHKPELASLETWVCRCVWTHFNSKIRYGVWRQLHARPMGSKYLDKPAKTLFDLHDLLWQVSEPAARVIHLVVNNGWKKTALLRALRRMGWNKKEIEKVFLEIQQAL